MKLSNRAYEVLKWIAMVFLPALTTFYGVLGATLKIPYVQETLTIMVAFDTFLGAILGISTANYNKTIAEMTTAEKIDKLLDDVGDDLK